MNRVGRSDCLSTDTSELELKRSENAAAQDVKIDGILPNAQLLIPAILVPITLFHSPPTPSHVARHQWSSSLHCSSIPTPQRSSPHHSTTPSLHYSITPLLHYSTTPLLHYSTTPPPLRLFVLQPVELAGAAQRQQHTKAVVGDDRRNEQVCPGCARQRISDGLLKSIVGGPGRP